MEKEKLAMMTEDGIEQMISALQMRGVSRKRSEYYVAQIGDCIEVENGKWVVRDAAGKIIDRIDPIE